MDKWPIKPKIFGPSQKNFADPLYQSHFIQNGTQCHPPICNYITYMVMFYAVQVNANWFT